MVLNRKYSTYTALLAGLIFIDQLSKYIIRTRGGFYICNQNLAFGIKPSYFIVFFASLLFIVFFIITAGRHKSQATNSKQIQNFNNQKTKRLQFEFLDFGHWNLFGSLYLMPWLLIVSGAVSNILDRLYFGCVIDFIDLHFWPVFNLADICITIGAMTIIAESLLKKDKL